MTEAINESSYYAWKADPVTKELFKFLKDTVEHIDKVLCSGGFSTNDELVVNYWKLIGQKHAYLQLLNIEFETLSIEETVNEM